MIVLDEHLMGLGLDREVRAWYEGQVCYITDLRPDTVIKDEAIPSLLLRERQPNFVTGDITGFWRKVKPHSNFCIVCFGLPAEQWRKIPFLLRRLFRTEGFRTKRERMGKVALVTETTVRFYAVGQPSITEIPLAK
ncbi:hypothetical protein [Fervidibacter sacchari]